MTSHPQPILIVGCGGHARSVLEIACSSSLWKPIGFIGQSFEVGSTIHGLPVLGTDDDLQYMRKKVRHVVIGIGQIKSSHIRVSIVNKLMEYNYILPSIAASSSIISKYAKIGKGTVVGHQTLINSDASIGEFCIINSGTILEHDCQIGDHTHVSTGVLINGNTTIGKHSFIGSGTVIREGLVLPPNTIVSAGKRIMKWPLL